MRDLQTDKVAHYAWMASYLINNDVTSLSEAEKKQADKFVEDIEEIYGQTASVIDCSEESVFGIPDWGGKPGSIVEYVVQYDFNKLPAEHWDLEAAIPEASRYCIGF
ncbi:hypothetical protein [Sphaerochaeta sp. S2]|uniref:hypothetical protein n=1 Tax=Sphaerochaeta sp. S2 TaxID=2798868 RepID=UPI0018EA2778|nr:hypothetical protein [Sphaerochaeta sp. S2]MBJ2355047.1 hypothetical protein [Sphaerochaeta sp. S2]